MSKRESALKPILDWVGGICAFLTVVVYTLLLVNASWAFLPEWLYNILVVCRTWAPLIVVAITGFEYTRERNFIVRLLFLLMLAAVVAGMFFPDTWNEFVGIVNKNV